MKYTHEDLTSQSDLAELLDVSQAWLSEATRDGKKVAGGLFDPGEYAVYDPAGNLKGYDVDEDDLPAPSVAMASGNEFASGKEDLGQDRSNGPMLPAIATETEGVPSLVQLKGRGLTTTAGGYQVDNSRVDRSHEEHHEKTTVSVVPEGTDVSEAGGYAAAGYAASAAMQANPEAAPMLMNILGTGAGALIGYEVTDSPGGALLGSLVGLVASESGRQLARRNTPRQDERRQRRLVGQSLR